MLPLAFKFDSVPVLVVGAGQVGARKAEQLIEAGALVTVIAEAILAPVPEGVVRVEERRYREGDLRGFLLVVSATGDHVVTDQIVEEAREERLWLNVVDDPARSTFYFMALHRQGEVTVAVTTEGAARCTRAARAPKTSSGELEFENSPGPRFRAEPTRRRCLGLVAQRL